MHFPARADSQSFLLSGLSDVTFCEVDFGPRRISWPRSWKSAAEWKIVSVRLYEPRHLRPNISWFVQFRDVILSVPAHSVLAHRDTLVTVVVMWTPNAQHEPLVHPDRFHLSRHLFGLKVVVMETSASNALIISAKKTHHEQLSWSVQCVCTGRPQFDGDSDHAKKVGESPRGPIFLVLRHSHMSTC